MGEKFKSYQNALNILDLPTLEKRREELCINFARRSSSHPKFRHLFPLNPKSHQMETRKVEKFKVLNAHTERFKKSAIIYMQQKLNED